MLVPQKQHGNQASQQTEQWERQKVRVLNGAFNTNGKQLITASNDGKARVWDWSRTGLPKRESELREHSGIWFGWGWRVRKFPKNLWPFTASPKLVKSTDLPSVNSAVFIPNKNFAVIGGDDQLVQIWHLDKQLLDTSKKALELRGHTQSIKQVAVSASDTYLRIASVGDDQTIRISEPCKSISAKERKRNDRLEKLCSPLPPPVEEK